MGGIFCSCRRDDRYSLVRGTLQGRSRGNTDELAKARSRARVTFPCIIGFVGGCAAAAALEVNFGLWALALPVVLSALAVPLGRVEE